MFLVIFHNLIFNKCLLLVLLTKVVFNNCCWIIIWNLIQNWTSLTKEFIWYSKVTSTIRLRVWTLRSQRRWNCQSAGWFLFRFYIFDYFLNLMTMNFFYHFFHSTITQLMTASRWDILRCKIPGLIVNSTIVKNFLLLWFLIISPRILLIKSIKPLL